MVGKKADDPSGPTVLRASFPAEPPRGTVVLAYDYMNKPKVFMRGGDLAVARWQQVGSERSYDWRSLLSAYPTLTVIHTEGARS